MATTKSNRKTTGGRGPKRGKPRGRKAAYREKVVPLKKQKGSTTPVVMEAVFIGLIAFSILMILSLFTKIGAGAVGGLIESVTKGLFGFFGYLIPFFIIGISTYSLFYKEASLAKSKTIKAVLLFICLASFMHIMGFEYVSGAKTPFVESVKTAYINGGLSNGGALGAVFGTMLLKVLGKAGSYILLVALIIIFSILLTGGSFFMLLQKAVAFMGQAFSPEKARAYDDMEDYEDDYDEEYEENDDGDFKENIAKKLPPIEKPKLPFDNVLSFEKGHAQNKQAHANKQSHSIVLGEKENTQPRILLVQESLEKRQGKKPERAPISLAERRKSKEPKENSPIITLYPTEGRRNPEDTVVHPVTSSFDEYEQDGYYEEGYEGYSEEADSSDAYDSAYEPEYANESEEDFAPIEIRRDGYSTNDYGINPEISDTAYYEEVTEDSLEESEQDFFGQAFQDFEPPFDMDIDEGVDSDVKRYADEIEEKIHEKEETKRLFLKEQPPTPFANPQPQLKPKPPMEFQQPMARKQEIEQPPTPVKKPTKYIFPSIDLLKTPPPISTTASRAMILENSRKLEETLKSFGVTAKVVEVSLGPTVTRYELAPGPGVKISKISSLADDLALNLMAQGIRIEAPIPGKAAVGIELPNKEVTPVFLREVLEDSEFTKFPSKLAFGLGKDIAGKTIVTDIARMPHLLIAGATGSGKSVCVNTLVTSIIYKASPDDVKLLMVDPKVVELSIYNGIPHLLIPVVTDPKKAAGALNWAVKEMITRYNLFAEASVRDLMGYNEYKRERGDTDFLPQIVIIIDELADLMMAAPNEVEDSICRLAQMARAAGLHLIIATQRPSVDVITGLIKANIPSRLAFAVSSSVDSRTVLDTTGAEKLLGKGDMLFFPVGMSKPIRIQGAFISDKEVEAIVSCLTQNQPQEYDQEMIDKITAVKSVGELDDQVDEFFEEAVEFVIQKEKASASMLQRQFRIGYNRASRLIEELEARGIVGEEDGSKPRKVLMTRHQWNEFKESRQ